MSSFAYIITPDPFITNLLDYKYDWSQPSSWEYQQLPVDGGNVVAVDPDFFPISIDGVLSAYYYSVEMFDDIPNLTLNSLQVEGDLTVSATLTVGTLTLTSSQVPSGYTTMATTITDTSGTLTIGGLVGTPTPITASAASAVIDVTGQTDPGEEYGADAGGEVELAAIPNAASSFNYDGSTPHTDGTFAFLGLGTADSTVSAQLTNVAPGDSVALPGGSVVSVVYNPSSIVITTRDGSATVTTTFSNVSYNSGYTYQSMSGYGASYDSASGLETVTFALAPATISPNRSGTYLWSNAPNWSNQQLPVDEGSVIASAPDILPDPSNSIVGTNIFLVDDIANLSLVSLTLDAFLDVTVTLTIRALTFENPGAGFASATIADTSGTLTIGGLAGASGTVEADGASAVIDVTGQTDPGEEYGADAGGEVVLAAIPNAASSFNYDGSTPHTDGAFAFLGLGTADSTVSAQLTNVAPGDSVALPGSSVVSVVYNPSSIAITTRDGAATVTTTFSNVSYNSGYGYQSFSDYGSSYDSASGLETVTFALAPATISPTITGFYLWSDASNWNNQQPPVDGDDVFAQAAEIPANPAISFPGLDVSLDDDIPNLNLNNLTVQGELYVIEALTVGTLTFDAGASSFPELVDAEAPGTVTIGGLGGASGTIEADGSGAVIDVTSPSDPGESFAVQDGAELELTAMPNPASALNYDGLSIEGTFAFLGLGTANSTVSAALTGVAPGDSVALPGSSVVSVVYNSSSIVITTRNGAATVTTTFSNVVYAGTIPNNHTVSTDTSGLLRITFSTVVVTSTLDVKLNQTATNNLLAGGLELDLYGADNGATVPVDSKLVVDASFSGYGVATAGEAHDALVQMGGELDINNGGEAFGSTIMGLEDVNGGGTDSGTEIGAGGAQYIFEAYSLIGTAIDTTVDTDGTQYVEFLGNASGADVRGTQMVEASATVDHTTIEEGGAEYVAPNGHTDHTVVHGDLYASGVATNTLVASDGTEIERNGNESGAMIFGMQDIFSLEQNATIGGGGLMMVEFGAEASNTTIMFGAHQRVAGTVAGEMLAGGDVEMLSGSGYEGSFTFTGGPSTLTIDSGALTGSLLELAGFGVGDVIDLANLSFNAADAVVIDPTTMKQLSIDENGADRYPINLDTAVDPATLFSLFDDGNGGTGLVVGSVVRSGDSLTAPEIPADAPLSVVSGGAVTGATVDAGANLSVLSGGMAHGLSISGTAVLKAGAMIDGAITLMGGVLEFDGALASGLSLGAVAGTGLSTVRGVTDPIEDYAVAPGAELMLSAMPNALSRFMYDTTVPGGEFAFTDPGGNVASLIGDLGPDDTLAVPGSMVNGVSIGATGISITTDLGTVNFTNVTYGNVVPTGYTFGADAATGLENITFAEIACYSVGTNIATARGERAIETLDIGDLVMTLAGTSRPIKWIGRRSYTGRFARCSQAIWPVIIRAGALSDGVPMRDLAVSPLHAMFIDGILVPAHALVNRVSVTQHQPEGEVTYIHVELDTHDVILAEGAPSETFIEDDSRGMFQNAADYAARYPNVPTGPVLYCAPRLTDGEAVAEIRYRIDERAGLATRTRVLGLASSELRVDVTAPGPITVAVPAGTSRVVVVAPAGRVAGGDVRVLGCAIMNVRLEGTRLAMDDPRLAGGFHPVEGERDDAWRWTDGAGALVLGAAATERVLDFNVLALADIVPGIVREIAEAA